MRRTPSARRRTRRRDTARPYAVVLAGALTLGVLVVIGAVAVRAPNGVPVKSYRTYYASIPDPGNIQPHNDVRVGGVRVGQVITIDPEGGRARVELKLDGDTEALPSDSQVFVRAAGLLGQRYVELRPGRSPQPLPEGSTIRGTDRALTYGVPDALNTFDEKTRAGLASTVDGLGVGLLGRGGDLNELFSDAVQAGPRFRDTVDLVLGERPGAVRRLAPSLRSATDVLNASRADQVAAYDPATRTFGSVNAQRSEVERTLDETPSTLRAATAGLDEGRALLASARALSSAAAATLPRAPRGLRGTSALLRESREPLQRAAALLTVAEQAVPEARKLVGSTRPLLKPVKEALDDALGPIRKTDEYGCDIDNFAENWRSALGFGVDGKGSATPLPSGDIGPLHFFRILPPFTPAGIQGASPKSSLIRSEPYTKACATSPGTAYPVTPTRQGPR